MKHDHLQKRKNSTTHQCWLPVGGGGTNPHPPANGGHAKGDQVLVGQPWNLVNLNLLRQKPFTVGMEALRTKKIYYVVVVVVDGAHPPQSPRLLSGGAET